jgi:catechol 1,2-dioxygenase
MTDEKRHEMLLFSDIFGLESLMDEITHTLAADNSTVPTALGPFWRANAPIRNHGDSISYGIESEDHTFMHGQVLDSQTGEPIEGADIDIWETAPNGKYESQDEDQVDMNLRGRFITPKDGSYSLYCLRPTTYSIPCDGPAGTLLNMLDRHPMRPAHIHVLVKAPGYNTVVTELFDRRDKHVYDDAVFAVKEDLIVDFKPREGDPKANFDLEYIFRLGHA